MKPIALDLFAGEGGSTQGYMDAGYDVIAVDNSAKALKRNPARWRVAADWRDGLGMFASEADLIHASPPCQGYSVTHYVHQREYPMLIPDVREALQQTGQLYVIENVEYSPLIEPVILCGSQAPFARYGMWNGRRVVLRRHRLFEANFAIPDAGEHRCKGIPSVPVFGHSAPRNRPDMRGAGLQQLRRNVMGLHGRTRSGLTQAIPPCYSAWVGQAALSALNNDLREAA
jgi:DNA (cytosine-5)-methyltransferase 1